MLSSYKENSSPFSRLQASVRFLNPRRYPRGPHRAELQFVSSPRQLKSLTSACHLRQRQHEDRLWFAGTTTANSVLLVSGRRRTCNPQFQVVGHVLSMGELLQGFQAQVTQGDHYRYRRRLALKATPKPQSIRGALSRGCSDSAALLERGVCPLIASTTCMPHGSGCATSTPSKLGHQTLGIRHRAHDDYLTLATRKTSQQTRTPYPRNQALPWSSSSLHFAWCSGSLTPSRRRGCQ